jgi:hypothetical protein
MGNRQTASGPGYATERVRVREARRQRGRHKQPLLSPQVLRRLPQLRRGPTSLRCALVQIGARLGFQAPAKVRWGYSGVAWLRRICSAVIGSAAQRRHARAAAKHRRVPAWASARKQERHIHHLPRAPLYRRAAVGCCWYSHGVLRVLTRGTFEYSQWYSAYWQGYCEYSHL